MVSVTEYIITKSQDSDWPLLAGAFVLAVGLITIAIWIVRFFSYVAT